MKVSRRHSTWGLWKAAVLTIVIACVSAAAPDRDDTRTKVGEVTNNLYDECVTEDRIFDSGSCMLPQECDLIGGVPSGSCAEGLGTCCIVKMGCDSDTALNNTYFVDPEDKNNLQGACTLTIKRFNEDICQIRLDFIDFHISQPNNDGHCENDFLTVTGGITTGLPIICGDNSGQHMYVDVDPDGGALELTVDIEAFSTQSWNIQVQQIGCDSRYKAPAGCLQYFTETSGKVESFNYKDDTIATGTRQLADQNYGVCIKKASGYCGIIWERDHISVYSFTVSSEVFAIDPSLIGTPDASSVGANRCLSDYVIIPGGVDDTKVQADRYCGLGFPNEVTSSSAPFVLHVKTDENESSDGGNAGFKLIYRQTVDCQTYS